MQRRRLPFPLHRALTLVVGRVRGERRLLPAVCWQARRPDFERERLVALADVAVYVGGRRASCSRKMGAVTFGDCRCRNGVTVPPPLHRALSLAHWMPTRELPLAQQKKPMEAKASIGIV